MNFEILILGCNSALSAHNRHPTSQLVSVNGKYYLIDCGEGAQNQMTFYGVKKFKIDYIFISHLHGDHYFGLIGLLTSYILLGRKTILHIYGPPMLEEIINLQLNAGMANLSYEIVYHTTQDVSKEVIHQDENVTVYSFPLKHRIPTTGFLFEEIKPLLRINSKAVEHLEDLEKGDYDNLREGKNILYKGIEIESSKLTLPGHKVRKYAFCSDTVYDETILDHIKGADLIYHETTFTKSEKNRALMTMHSTSEDAAIIAKKAQVKELIIGHFSSKYTDLNIFQDECREIFPNTKLALEGETFKIEKSY